MINYLSNVYILEDIDLSPMKALMEEFQQAKVN